MKTSIRSPLLLLVALSALSAAAAWQSSTSAPEGLVPPLRPGGPTYWKGNLHTHSFWSDGDDFPEMIADRYKIAGYHFLALSDHNILSEGDKWVDVPEKGTRPEALQKYLARFGERWVERRTVKVKNKDLETEKQQVRLKPLSEFRALLEEPSRFLMIPAEEITHKFAKSPVHINAINLRDVITPVDGDSIEETIRANLRGVADQRKKTGWRTIAFLNHPNFGWGVRAEDMILADELRYFEVFNGHPGVRNYGDDLHPGCEKLWDIVLALRLGKHKLPILYGLATDDAHNYHVQSGKSANMGRGWIMVRAPYLTPEAIAAALEAGDFYASSGVNLHSVERKADRLSLAIEAEKGVAFKTQFIATFKDASFDSEPRKDAKGKPADVTRHYSPDIGKVVAESDDLQPSYRFTGNELYVRARVISTKAHPNPFQKGDMEMAWTQPMTP